MHLSKSHLKITLICCINRFKWQSFYLHDHPLMGKLPKIQACCDGKVSSTCLVWMQGKYGFCIVYWGNRSHLLGLLTTEFCFYSFFELPGTAPFLVLSASLVRCLWFFSLLLRPIPPLLLPVHKGKLKKKKKKHL